MNKSKVSSEVLFVFAMLPSFIVVFNRYSTNTWWFVLALVGLMSGILFCAFYESAANGNASLISSKMKLFNRVVMFHDWAPALLYLLYFGELLISDRNDLPDATIVTIMTGIMVTMKRFKVDVSKSL